MKKSLLAILLTVWGYSSLLAVFGTAGGAAPFLRTGAGARALSLSSAFTAYYDDSTCSYWNPASTALIKQAAVSSMFSWLTEDRSYSFFNVLYPSIYGSFALNIITSSAGQIEGRLADTLEHTTFTDSESAYFLTYGRKIYGNIYLGVNLKYLYVSLDTYGANGFSGDLGALIKFNDFASFGIVFQDLAGNMVWTTGTDEKIPLVMRIGSLFRFMDGDIKWSVDANENEYDGPSLKSGVEAVIIKIISLRAGISYGVSNYKFDYTFGGGLKYAFSSLVLQLDYCFLKEEYYRVFQANHKISLNIYFNI